MRHRRHGTYLNASARPGERPDFAQVGGCLVAHHRAGEGRPVVVLHGVPGGRRHMWRLSEALAHGCAVVTPDLPGFGATAPCVAPSLDAFAETVLGLTQALALPPVALVGHAMGAAIALRAATLEPDRVAAVALLSPVGLRPHGALESVGYPSVEEADVLHLPEHAAALTLLGRRLARGRLRRLARSEVVQAARFHAALDFADLRDAAARIDKPVMIVRAADDDRVEEGIFEELLGAMPSVRHVRFPAGGHFVQNTLAEEIVGVLHPWLEEVSG